MTSLIELTYRCPNLNEMDALQQRWDALLAPQRGETLSHLLWDSAHGGGEQVVVCLRDGRPVSCASWVLLGIEQDGCAYGSPVILLDAVAALPVLDAIITAANNAHATRLRIAARPVEIIKYQALVERGFTRVFDFLTLGLDLPQLAATPIQSELKRIDIKNADWQKLHALYRATFADVPNAPLPALDAFMKEWEQADAEASSVLVDAAGNYIAFCMMIGVAVEAVGVKTNARGQGLARQLYAHAAGVLHQRCEQSMSALVANTNLASVNFHTALGFTESAPRRSVYELDLRT